MAKQRFRSKVRGTPEYKRRQKRLGKVRKAVDPLAGEVNAAANLQYGEAESGLQSQLRVSDANAARIPAYFSAYKAELERLRGAQQQGYESARQDIERLSSNPQAAQANAQALTGAQAQANVTGGTVDPGAARGAQAIGSRQSASDVFSGQLRSHQANANTYALNQQGTAEGGKISELISERNKRKGIETKQTDLAKEKGAYRVKARESIIEARHKRILERKAFRMNVSKAEQNALDDAIKNQTAQDRIDLGQQNATTGRARLTETQRHNRQQEAAARRRAAAKGKAGGKRRYTPLQKRNAHEDLRSAIADAKAIKPKKGEGKTLVDYLRQGDPGANRKGETRPKRKAYSPAIARAAAMLAIYGRLDKKTRKMLMDDYGIGGV